MVVLSGQMIEWLSCRENVLFLKSRSGPRLKGSLSTPYSTIQLLNYLTHSKEEEISYDRCRQKAY